MARDTALFVGIVPEGQYVVESLTHGKTKKFIALNARSSERLGVFTVKAGAVSDLGRIIVAPMNDKVIVGRSQRVRANSTLIKRFAPESAGIYDGAVNVGWISPRSQEDVVEEYALQMPVGADAMTEMPDGGVVAASRLGTVMVRSPAGKWRAIRSEGLESLLWIKPYASDNSVLLAVGEFDTMLRLDKKGLLNWIDPGNLPAGNVIFIDGNKAAGWFVALQHGREITLFQSRLLENGDWHLLRSESVESSFWSGASSFWIWSTKRGFAYAVSAGQIRYYDFAAQQWTERAAPTNARLLRVAPQPGDTLGILTSPRGAAGDFVSVYLSRDAGATWEESKSPFNVTVAPPYVSRGGTLLMQGGASGSPELQESKDKGKTWQQVSDGIGREEQLVVLQTKGLFSTSSGAETGIGTIKRSTDNGRNWTVEYSTFDKDAYEVQKLAK
jgi:hypothetical protein